MIRLHPHVRLIKKASWYMICGSLHSEFSWVSHQLVAIDVHVPIPVGKTICGLGALGLGLRSV